jgi:hypothetical protein
MRQKDVAKISETGKRIKRQNTGKFHRGIRGMRGRKSRQEYYAAGKLIEPKVSW